MENQLIDSRISAAEEIAGRQMTVLQRAFVYNIFQLGGDETAAARAAGYANPTIAVQQLRRTDIVQLAIRDEINSQFQAAAIQALGHYRQVLIDETASATAKNAAAEAILNRAGYPQAKKPDDASENKDLDELETWELEAMITGLESEKIKRRQSDEAVDGEVIPENQ